MAEKLGVSSANIAAKLKIITIKICAADNSIKSTREANRSTNKICAVQTNELTKRIASPN